MMAYIDRDKVLNRLSKLSNIATEPPMDNEDEIRWKLLHKLQKEFSEIPIADVVEVKQIEIIRDDLKWWLETNTEKGVVYIPEHIVENMIAKMDGGKTE